MPALDVPRFVGYLHDPPVVVDDSASQTRFEPIPPEECHTEVARHVVQLGVEAVAYRDGLVVFDIPVASALSNPGIGDPTIGDAVAWRVRLCNAHLACLHSAMWDEASLLIKKSSLVARSLVYGVAGPDGSLEWLTHDPYTRAVALVPGRAFNPWAIGLSVHLDARWVPYRRVVTPAMMLSSFKLLGHALSAKGYQGLHRYELLLKAAAAAEDHDYDLALSYAWFVIESAATELWSREAKALARSAGGSVAAASMKTMNSKATLDLLKMAGILPLDLWKILDGARKVRNRFVHDLKPVTSGMLDGLLMAAGVLLSSADQTPYGVTVLDDPAGFAL